MIICNYEQRSEGWFKAKAGVPSASNFSKIITPTGKPSKQAKDYLLQLVGEKLLGRVEEGYTSFAMQQGIDREDEARSFYELRKCVDVREVGLVFKDEKRDRSCSPDGLLGDGGLEIKCPMLKTHVKYLLDGKLPNEYFCQVHGSMYITGSEWWDFMSYYPGLKPLIITVERDYDFTNKLHGELEKFTKDLDKTIKKLKENGDGRNK